MAQTPGTQRMTAARPITPRLATTTNTSRQTYNRDDNQDTKIADLHQRVTALEQLVDKLTQFISVNQLNELVINADGNIFIQSNGNIQIGASILKVSSVKSEFSAPLTQVSGVLQTDTLIAKNVIGSSYTPGAGNIW